jgi:hypothetical protein
LTTPNSLKRWNTDQTKRIDFHNLFLVHFTFVF